MGVIHCLNMKVFIVLTSLIALSTSAPKYLVIPIEDVDFGSSSLVNKLPIYRLPSLARHARAAQEEDSYQTAPIRRQDTASSNAYAAPAPVGPDHVDYGAYTGGYGAFGWYTDHPVLLAGH